MKTGLQQQAGMRQELRINPRLYQAMDMLYMPMLDLQQHLQHELLSNPFLELEEPEEEDTVEKTTAEEQEEAKKDDEVDWEEILLHGFEVGGTREQFESKDYVEPQSVAQRDLADHLRDQLQMLDLPPRLKLLSEELLGNIDDEGYLTCCLDEVLSSANQWVLESLGIRGRAGDPVDPDEADPFELPAPIGEQQTGSGDPSDRDKLAPPVRTEFKLPDTIPDGIELFRIDELETAMTVVQGLDPAGVGARDLRECLMIQMGEAGATDTLAWRMVDEAFDDIKAHRWNDVARRFAVSAQEAQAAADTLVRYDPKPGLRYSDRGEGYVVPDLIVERIDGSYRVFLNDTGMPRLRLSRSYQEIARDRSKMTAENRDFIASRLNSATWMIQAIEQRRQTMLKVMNFIVDRQREFFDKGIEFLKPLTLREVAEVISMHESTVSRVTNDKYVQTPRGVLPLKFFFSSALATATGEDASARSIRAKLEKLVADEDSAKPLTDQHIVHLFAEQGIRIARRTVAKYRDQLGILPARMRKRV